MRLSPRSIRRAVLVMLLLTAAQAGARGQGQPAANPPAPQPSPTPSLESRFVKNILRDQRAIWTAPFHVARGDARWLAPLGVSGVVLFATDHRTARALAEHGDNLTRLRISKAVSRGGALYTTGAVSGAFYLVGRATKNARAREAGLLGAEAIIDSEIVTVALKTASQRPRPRVDDASGEFFDGGDTFPSGHAASAWALATVLAHEYGRRRPLVRVGAYGLAAAVSVSRYTGRRHFLSDVLVGSAVGFGIGRYVYRTHHDPSLDDDPAKSGGARSKLIPFAAPVYSRAERTYGLALAWNF